MHKYRDSPRGELYYVSYFMQNYAFTQVSLTFIHHPFYHHFTGEKEKGEMIEEGNEDG